MESVTSKDGTKIAYKKSGAGAPLIITGGSLADHTFYDPLAAELAKDFTTYTFDRRNRGESGDTLPYSVEREVEDVSALIDLIDEPVILYGHSAGSALALLVAASDTRIARLIMADPPYTPHENDDVRFKSQFEQEKSKVQELHDAGRYKENVANFLGGMGMPEHVIEGILSSPAGLGMIANAKALPYDYALLGDGLVPTELAARVEVATIILADVHAKDAAQQLAYALRNAEVKELAQSTHEMAPADIARVIKAVLKVG